MPRRQPSIFRRPASITSPSRASNYARARRFYIDTLGFDVALEKPNLFIFFAGQTAIAVRGPAEETPTGDTFNPFRVGLDHVALACTDEAELARVAGALAEAGIENTGIDQYISSTDGTRMTTSKEVRVMEMQDEWGAKLSPIAAAVYVQGSMDHASAVGTVANRRRRSS